MSNNERNEKLHRSFDLIEDEFIVEAAPYNAKPMTAIRRAIIKRVAIIAACLCVVIALIFTIPALIKEKDKPFVKIENQQMSASAPVFYGNSFAHFSPSSTFVSPITGGLSVTAEFLEALPDVYVFYDDMQQYNFRLIRMRTISRLKGLGMPDEFYYLIPVDFMTDFSAYDKFVIIDMSHFGYENSVMYNKTQGCAERFELAIFGSESRYTLGCGFIAFDKRGNFDERLWDSNEAWKKATKYRPTLKNLKSVEKETYFDNTSISVFSLKELTEEAAAALEKITSFENGLYVFSCKDDKQHNQRVYVSATRYINGFATNEEITIIGDCIYHGDYYEGCVDTEVEFTPEDINSVPDLAAATAKIDKMAAEGKIIPPHIKDYQNSTNVFYGVFGWYAKTNDGVIGIIKLSFSCRSPKNKDLYDDAYYVVKYGSDEITPVDRDDLLDLPGHNFVYSGAYDDKGKVPSDWPEWLS